MSTAPPVLARVAEAMGQGRDEEAQRLLQPYLRTRPDDAVALVMLAELGLRAGVYPQAEGIVRKAITLAPGYLPGRFTLAQLLFKQHRSAEALAVVDALLAQTGGDPRILSFKATLLDQLGDYAQAAALYEQLLEQGESSAALWVSYGHKLRTIGRTDDAVAAYRKALALEPASGEAWWSLANVKTASFGEADVAVIEAALKEPGLSPDSQSQLHFTLGRIFELRRSFEPSFRQYAAGNRIKRDTLQHDPSAVTRGIDHLIRLFSADFFRQRAGFGAAASDPVFIVGMPRSGSTLIEQMLACHSMIEGTSELPHIPAIVGTLSAAFAGASYPDLLAGLNSAQARAIGEDYLKRTAPHRRTGRPFFIDKLPRNWSDIGLIQLILPNARVIDARREPMACCFSNYKQFFFNGYPATYALADMGAYYRDYVRLLAHFDTVLPKRIHRVHHEQLVDSPRRELERLLAYLELPFEEQCLDFHRASRPVSTASSEQVRQPLNREGMAAWRPFEPWLEPLKEALGPVLTSYPDVPAEWH
jgi:tetratricopeptide (TPR) repeat protein